MSRRWKRLATSVQRWIRARVALTWPGPTPSPARQGNHTPPASLTNSAHPQPSGICLSAARKAENAAGEPLFGWGVPGFRAPSELPPPFEL